MKGGVAVGEFQKKLIIIYSIILVLLSSIPILTIIFKQKQNKLKMLLLFLMFLPIVSFGFFGLIVTSYSIAELLVEDDFVSLQILTNTANIFALWTNYQVLIKKK